MKRIVTFSALALTLLSFTASSSGIYTISGNAPGLSDGTKILLEKPDDKLGVVIVDSTVVSKEKFTFKGTASEPGIHLVEIKSVQGKVAFIVEEGNIKLTLYKDSIAKSRIGGTLSNDDLQQFNLGIQKVQKKLSDFETVNMQKMTDAQAQKDTAVINQLMDEYQKIQGEMMALSAEFPAKNPKSYLSVLFIDNMFNSPGANIARIKDLFNKLDPKLKETTQGKKIQQRIANFTDLSIGNIAPDFSAPTPDGKTASLKQSLGKVTIIDFWASWCGPCRKENPSVVALYNEFHSKGLNIIGVSLDKDGKKWMEAIEKDGLTWTHVSNLQFWTDPVAKMYNVNSIPATFILDAEGKIVAKDLRGEVLRAKIAELLNK
jgi:peroxiredoxin